MTQLVPTCVSRSEKGVTLPNEIWGLQPNKRVGQIAKDSLRTCNHLRRPEQTFGLVMSEGSFSPTPNQAANADA